MAKQEEIKKSPEFNIQRLYVKDISFETPNSPEMFKATWKPEVNVDLHVENKLLEEDIYEVVLKITITTKLDKKTAFLAEVSQVGIFTIKNFVDEQLKAMLGSFCPNILFPYAREVVSDLTNRGGFPPLYLAPVNFDALYQQQLEKGKSGTIH